MAPELDIDYLFSNDVFRLGWLEDPRLRDTGLVGLARIAGSLLPKKGASEEDTQAIFIEPLLRGLGWETLCHSEVDRAPRRQYPDYELFAGDRRGAIKRVALVEVKALGWEQDLRVEPLDQLRDKYLQVRLEGRVGRPEHVTKLGDEPVLSGVVTDGARWYVYDFHLHREKELRCEFDLQHNPNVAGLVENLGRRQVSSRFGL